MKLKLTSVFPRVQASKYVDVPKSIIYASKSVQDEYFTKTIEEELLPLLYKKIEEVRIRSSAVKIADKKNFKKHCGIE